MSVASRAASQWPFQIGDRVEITGEIDLLPYTIVQKGERGTVVYVSDNQTLIELDTHHHFKHADWHGLGHHENCMWVIPDDPTVDETLRSLKRLPRERASPCKTGLSLASASQW